MKLQLIRNATLRITCHGHTLLIDPFLAASHTLPAYAGKSANPLVPLPVPAEAVAVGIDLVLLSHLHGDHFDVAAQALLPKDTPIFCQPGDEAAIAEHGFHHVTPIDTDVTWRGITITRTPGQHGSSKAVLRAMGTVSGFVLRATAEPTLYFAGDTILIPTIHEIVARHRPDAIVTHSGGAVWGSNEFIIMDAEQTVALCQASLHSTIIATHLEALDHCTVSRQALRDYARQHGIADDHLLIPADGESIELVC